MAKFTIAEAITGRNEGGYANNPSDNGGETYAGIARNHWPKWEGWKIIDNIKFSLKEYKLPISSANINKYAKLSVPLTDLISKFYSQNFWDVNNLDLINDQQLANSVYDFGVNSGTGRAAKFLQWAYNNEQAFNGTHKKIAEDGKIGPKTLEAINNENPEEMYNCFNTLRETFYRSIAKGNQAQFLKSWLSRLKPYKR